jgi:hypothetical protein
VGAFVIAGSLKGAAAEVCAAHNVAAMSVEMISQAFPEGRLMRHLRWTLGFRQRIGGVPWTTSPLSHRLLTPPVSSEDVLVAKRAGFDGAIRLGGRRAIR